MPLRRSLPDGLLVCAAALALTACAKGNGDDDERAETRPAAAALNPAIGPQPDEALRDPRARIFLTKGCPQCHSISALHVTSPTNAGPDLTLAVSDVQSRFSTTIEQFLQAPTGTMQIVLAGQISLTAAERDSIATLLRALNQNP